jgi:hypothetical protein
MFLCVVKLLFGLLVFTIFPFIIYLYAFLWQRDDIGIGGTWSDFVDYLKCALSSGDVKIVLSKVFSLCR